jgi:superfamily I DNA and RNA helicase
VLDKHGEDIGTATRLQESLIVENLPSAEAKQLDMFDALSEEARQVVNNHTVRLVRGVAGSGKTLVLLNRALFLREHYPHSQSLMLTFNRDLADYLHRRTPQIQVLNFHRLCSKIIGRGWHSPQDARGWLNKYQRANLAQMSLPSSYDPIKYAQEEFTWRKDLGLFDTSEYLDADRIGRTLSFSQERRQILDNIFQEYLGSTTE